MFNAKVYKISVVSLSGMMEEIYATKQTILQWNQDNAEHTGKMFLLVDGPQSADVLVGVVDNRIENKELVVESLNAGKRVMLFFNAFADPNNTIPNEQTVVVAFHNQMQQRCFCAEFSRAAQLTKLINEQLKMI